MKEITGYIADNNDRFYGEDGVITVYREPQFGLTCHKVTLKPFVNAVSSDVGERLVLQPTDVEQWMKDKLKDRMITNEAGWTGEFRVSAKHFIDMFIDLVHSKTI